MAKYNNKTDQLTDKAFSRFVFMSILTIVLCIFGLCGTTFAWFTANTANSNNTVKSGSFELNVTVTDHLGAELNVTKKSDGTHNVTLDSGIDYTVTLEVSDRTNVSRGYCLIKIGEQTYSTDTMRRSETEPYTFTLHIDGEGTSVIFDPNWSAAKSVEVENGGSLLITPSNNIIPDTNYDN